MYERKFSRYAGFGGRPDNRVRLQCSGKQRNMVVGIVDRFDQLDGDREIRFYIVHSPHSYPEFHLATAVHNRFDYRICEQILLFPWVEIQSDRQQNASDFILIEP